MPEKCAFALPRLSLAKARRDHRTTDAATGVFDLEHTVPVYWLGIMAIYVRMDLEARMAADDFFYGKLPGTPERTFQTVAGPITLKYWRFAHNREEPAIGLANITSARRLKKLVAMVFGTQPNTSADRLFQVGYYRPEDFRRLEILTRPSKKDFHGEKA